MPIAVVKCRNHRKCEAAGSSATKFEASARGPHGDDCRRCPLCRRNNRNITASLAKSIGRRWLRDTTVLPSQTTGERHASVSFRERSCIEGFGQPRRPQRTRSRFSVNPGFGVSCCAEAATTNIKLKRHALRDNRRIIVRPFGFARGPYHVRPKLPPPPFGGRVCSLHFLDGTDLRMFFWMRSRNMPQVGGWV